MKSPFFLQNASLIPLLLLNFAFSVWLIVRKPDEIRVDSVDSAAIVEKNSTQKNPLAWRIILRSLYVVYATASCLFLIQFALQFRENEFSPQYQENWRQRSSFPQVKAGMTQKQVTETMGDPQEVWRNNNNDQYRYWLGPSGLPEIGSVFFDADPKNPGGSVIVTDKWPDDKRLNAINHNWLRHLSWEYWDPRTISDKMMGLSCMGLVLLAAISLVPFWQCRDWASLALYFPVIALTLGLAHEATRRGDLRLQIFLNLPAFIVIAAVWLIRVIYVASR